MSATKQTRLFLAQVDTSGKVLINVAPGVVVDGELHEKPFENVFSTTDASPALAAAAKAFLDACAAVVAAETVVDQPAVAEVPEVPAVVDPADAEKILKPAVAAIPAIAETRKPRYVGAVVQ
jgi:hypothetical protein